MSAHQELKLLTLSEAAATLRVSKRTLLKMIRLFNKESGLLEPLASRNIDEQEWRAEPWRGGRGIQKLVFESKAPQMIRNVHTDPRMRDIEFFRKYGLVSCLGVPLMVKDEAPRGAFLLHERRTRV